MKNSSMLDVSRRYHRKPKPDEMDKFIYFIEETTTTVFAAYFTVWLKSHEYDWQDVLYDIHCDIDDIFQPHQSNIYLFLKQQRHERLFESIYTKYLDDIRALNLYDTQQWNAKIDRTCICHSRLKQSTVKARIIEYSPDVELKPEIVCNQCFKKRTKNDVIFYCPNKSEKHPNGYDICNPCALQNNLSPSDKFRSLQQEGYKIGEIGDALDKMNGDENAAKAYLAQQKQHKRDTEKELDALYRTDGERIAALIHPSNIEMKQNTQITVVDNKTVEKEEDEKKASDVDPSCATCDIESCVNLETILFALNNTDEELNIALVLNAFLHLMDAHNEDADFEFIRSQLQFCDVNQCDVFRRHYRNRTNSSKEPDVRQQCLDKIHCYYQHSHDLGHRSRSQTDAKDKKEVNINDTIHAVSHQKQKTRQYVHRFREPQQYNNQRPSEGRGNNMASKPSTAFSNNAGYYSFGVEFKYVTPGDNSEMDAKGDETSRVKALLVRNAAHASLKEEMTQNAIARMTMEQFNNEYIKALMHFDSFYRRVKYRNMSMEHVLSLLIYSNFDVLQCEFSKTYRRAAKETDEQLVERHEQFYFLGRNLKYAVNTFGNISKYKLYHGISQKLIFPAYLGNVVINSPLSTTSSIEVAINFADVAGLIVQFKPTESHSNEISDSSCLSFQMHWLSDFASEKEHLYIQCDGVFGIENVIDTITRLSYAPVLKALDIIDTQSRAFHEEFGISMQNLIRKIIHHQLSHTLSCYDAVDGLDAYAKDIIHVYCQNKAYCEITFGNKVFEAFEMLEHKWIHMKLIHILFPNVQFIHLRNVNLCKFSVEYLFNYLQQIKTKASNLKVIWIKPTEDSDWDVSGVVTAYEKQFQTLNFTMRKLEKTGFKDGKGVVDRTYLAIENNASAPIKFVNGKKICNKPKFGTFYSGHYDKAKHKTHIWAANLSRIWCYK
eukprot:1072001_1